MPRHPDDMLPEHFEHGGCTREDDEANCGCEEDDCECSECDCMACNPPEPREEWDPDFDDSFMYDCERY